jgi:hypothetical protein
MQLKRDMRYLSNEEKEIQQEYLEALRSKNADYILWTQRYTPENMAKIKIAA